MFGRLVGTHLDKLNPAREAETGTKVKEKMQQLAADPCVKVLGYSKFGAQRPIQRWQVSLELSTLLWRTGKREDGKATNGLLAFENAGEGLSCCRVC
eukprot:SAG31_NODE_2688_length_5250_cov_11.245583_3_plen_97_part_00